MKHTKGKWRLQKHVEDINDVSFTVESDIPEAKNFSICDVYGYNMDETKANAKLISKAPEMYEALKDLTQAAYDGKNLFNVQSRVRQLLKEIES